MRLQPSEEDACLPHQGAWLLFPALTPDSSFLLMPTRLWNSGQPLMAQEIGFLRSMWETWIEFPAPACSPNPGY